MIYILSSFIKSSWVCCISCISLFPVWSTWFPQHLLIFLSCQATVLAWNIEVVLPWFSPKALSQHRVALCFAHLLGLDLTEFGPPFPSLFFCHWFRCFCSVPAFSFHIKSSLTWKVRGCSAATPPGSHVGRWDVISKASVAAVGKSAFVFWGFTRALCYGLFQCKYIFQ